MSAARGQYAEGWIHGEKLPRYRDEPGVAVHSDTETYAALKLYVDNWRWQDVPFYLRTGKRMTATCHRRYRSASAMSRTAPFPPRRA